MKKLLINLFLFCMLTSALAISLIRYEQWVYIRGEENRFHAATLILTVAGDQHRFTYKEPLVFFDDFTRAEQAMNGDHQVILNDTQFHGAGIIDIKCVIQAHSDHVDIALKRDELARMQLCRCDQRARLGYSDKIKNGLELVRQNVAGLMGSSPSLPAEEPIGDDKPESTRLFTAND